MSQTVLSTAAAALTLAGTKVPGQVSSFLGKGKKPAGQPPSGGGPPGGTGGGEAFQEDPQLGEDPSDHQAVVYQAEEVPQLAEATAGES
jgi:hypothetical protein